MTIRRGLHKGKELTPKSVTPYGPLQMGRCCLRFIPPMAGASRSIAKKEFLRDDGARLSKHILKTPKERALIGEVIPVPIWMLRVKL